MRVEFQLDNGQTAQYDWDGKEDLDGVISQANQALHESGFAAPPKVPSLGSMFPATSPFGNPTNPQPAQPTPPAPQGPPMKSTLQGIINGQQQAQPPTAPMGIGQDPIQQILGANPQQRSSVVPNPNQGPQPNLGTPPGSLNTQGKAILGPNESRLPPQAGIYSKGNAGGYVKPYDPNAGLTPAPGQFDAYHPEPGKDDVSTFGDAWTTANQYLSHQLIQALVKGTDALGLTDNRAENEGFVNDVDNWVHLGSYLTPIGGAIGAADTLSLLNSFAKDPKATWDSLVTSVDPTHDGSTMSERLNHLANLGVLLYGITHGVHVLGEKFNAHFGGEPSLISPESSAMNSMQEAIDNMPVYNDRFKTQLADTINQKLGAISTYGKFNPTEYAARLQGLEQPPTFGEPAISVDQYRAAQAAKGPDMPSPLQQSFTENLRNQEGPMEVGTSAIDARKFDPQYQAREQFVDNNWQVRTQGLLNAIDQEIQNTYGAGRRLGPLKRDLVQSLADGKPDLRVAQELYDIYDAKNGNPAEWWNKNDAPNRQQVPTINDVSAQPVAGQVPVSDPTIQTPDANPIRTPDPSQNATAANVEPVKPTFDPNAHADEIMGATPVNDTTDLTMATRRAEAAQGLRPEPESVPGMSNPDMHAYGKNYVEQNGVAAGEALARQLADQNRAAQPAEYGVMLETSRRLRVELNDAAKGLDGSPEAQAKYNAIRDRIDAFDTSLDKVKGASGQSLQALQVRTTIDTGDYAQVRAEKMRSLQKQGQEITPEIEAHIKDLTDRVRTAEEAYQDLKSKHDAAQEALVRNQATMEEMQSRVQTTSRAATQPRPPAARAARLERIQADRAAAREELRQSMAKLNANPVDVLLPLGKLAWTYVDEGITVKLPDLIAKVKEEVKKTTGKDVSDQDVIDGMHAARPPKTRDGIKSELSKLYQEIRKGNSDYLKAKAGKKAFVDAQKEAQQSVGKTTENVHPDDIAKAIKAKQKQFDVLKEALDTGNFDKVRPKTKPPVDYGPQFQEAARQVDETRNQVRREIAKQDRGLSDKVLNFRRAEVISGTGPIAKIPVSSAIDTAISPVENIAARLAKAARGLSSDVEGKASAESVKQAVLGALSKETLEGMKGVVKNEGTPLSRAYGDHQLPTTRAEKIIATPANTHEALMYPRQLSVFKSTMQKLIEAGAKRGVDVSDYNFLKDAGERAHQAGLQAVYRNDNALTKWFGKSIGGLSRTNKNIIKMTIPVMNLPTNVAGRFGEYAFGLPYGSYLELKAKIQGVDMEPHQVDAVIRAYKRGGVGAGLFTMGFLFPQLSQNLPGVMGHSPIGMMFELGGQARKEADSKNAPSLGKQIGDVGIMAARKMLTTSPVSSVPHDILNAVGGTRYKDESTSPMWKFLMRELDSWLFPGAVQSVSHFFDDERVKQGKAYYKTSSPEDYFRKDFPYLRQQLPVVESKH